jgi:indolepyruvate ferredoxin oxidoreductase alpha subunit
MTRKLLSGDEAVARGAWEAGCHVAAAYPGTPSTEILESLAGYKDVYCEWSVNEKVALEVALGASIAGARALCAMKHVGLNVAADPLFSAAYIGARGGLVVVTADDPGLHSSQNEQDNRNYGVAARLPVLCPADSRESRDFTRRAFELSEQFDIPVLLRLTTRVAHSSGVVEVAERTPRAVQGYEKQIMKNMILPAFARVRHMDLESRVDRVRAWNNTSDLNRVEPGTTDLGIICDGVAYQYAREVFPDASFLKLGMVWPFPDERVLDFCHGLKRLLVVEEVDPFIETQVRALGIVCAGKDRLPRTGELSPRIVRKAMSLPVPDIEPEPDLPNRPPALCPGCPHTGVFFALQKQPVIIGGDIGCYTLGALPPHSAMDTCVDMGASVTIAHGIDKALGTSDPRVRVAVIGDSTFFHSGMTGLVNTVYNQSNVITIISDNRTTGMTGHQPHPGTGSTLMAQPAPALDPAEIARACGIKQVVEVDPYRVKETRKQVRALLKQGGPAVIVARRACALLIKLRNPPKRVAADKCIGCKTCIGLGCPALSFRNGKSLVAETVCVGCGMCVDVCPKEAIA